MSCNGCRVLRKGCSDSCILRPCLQWIETPEAQGNATVFVAKFFGRAGLMSFISAVPDNQRPALFQSLLFEACGRTVNPVNGAVGLLGTGNWHVCQRAVETVLRGGMLRPLPEFIGGGGIQSAPTLLDSDNRGTLPSDHQSSRDPYFMRTKAVSKRKKQGFEDAASVKLETSDLGLSLTSSRVVLAPSKVGSSSVFNQNRMEKQRPTTPSSQESGTTSLEDSCSAVGAAARDVCYSASTRGETKLLRLFV